MSTPTQSESRAYTVRRVREALPGRIRSVLSHRYAWVTPAIGLLLSLTLFPFLYLVYLSFHRWSLNIAAQRSFIGLENYATVLQGAAFGNALANTVLFVVVSVALEMVVGVTIALFLHFRIPERWRSVLQTMFLLPMMMAYIVVGLLWRFLWNGSLGLINFFLQTAGLPAQNWLGNPQWVLGTIIVADIWQWTPFVVLVVLAGLQGLPKDELEAALLDGASFLQRFRYIMLPNLKPILFVTMMFRAADAYRIFDKVWTMTQGGPGNSSMVLSVLIYFQSFRDGNFGIAAAMSVAMLAVISVAATLMIKRARSTGAI
jgi:multiple sugar transport system permease protein